MDVLKQMFASKKFVATIIGIIITLGAKIEQQGMSGEDDA